MPLGILTEGAGTVVNMENLTSGMQTLFSLAGSVLDFCLANPVLCLCFAGGFVTIAVGIIHSVKNI